MTKQITLEEALKLVSFYQLSGGSWRVLEVNGYIKGSVNGNVYGDVRGYVNGNVNGYVDGNVNGNVLGNVLGTINGREWKFIETPKDKLQRLIEDSGNQELIDTFNQMKNN
jgi:hypothetical protein